jgi:membrane-associated phospholipid phosphatase
MKRIILLLFIIFFSKVIPAQDSAFVNEKVPFTKVFYEMDKNFLGSFTYNYGWNFALAGAASYGMVKTGIDWGFYKFSNNNKWVSNAGFISVSAGGLAPLAVPLGIYLYGRNGNNTKLQLVGLAMGQAAVLGIAISSGIKVFTGRVAPDFPERTKDYSGDFRFGFLRGGAFEGWPSSHTTIAFAMATTLADLYPDNMTVQICSYTYASLIGVGVSTNIHWFSDAVAGAFIGYAIGKTVGTSFNRLINGTEKKQNCNVILTPSGLGLAINF